MAPFFSYCIRFNSGDGAGETQSQVSAIGRKLPVEDSHIPQCVEVEQVMSEG
jgi:hypothetical protein